MPLKGAEFCKLAKVSRIGGYNYYSQAAGAHCNQRVIGQAPFAYLLITALGC